MNPSKSKSIKSQSPSVISELSHDDCLLAGEPSPGARCSDGQPAGSHDHRLSS